MLFFYCLEGGRQRRPSKTGSDKEDNEERLKTNDEKNLEDAVNDHVDERMEHLAEVHRLAHDAFLSGLSFDDIFQEAANIHDGQGWRGDEDHRDIQNFKHERVNEFTNVDCAHTVALGLKEFPRDKINDPDAPFNEAKHERLRKLLGHTNRLPSVINRSLHRVVDNVQAYPRILPCWFCCQHCACS